MFKKLTYRFLILLALVFVLDRGVGKYLDHLYEKNRCDYSNGKINAFLDQDKCDTLYMGSSRVLHLINPKIIGPNTRSLAFQRKNISFQVGLIDILRSKGKLPKTRLILNLEVEDLYNESDDKLLRKIYSLKYYYNQNDKVKELINRLGIDERIKFLSEIYRHNGEGWKLISYPMSENCVLPSLDGYHPLYPTKNDSLRMAKSLVDDFKPLKFKKINPLTLELLDYVVETCKKKSIELLIINNPYYKCHPEIQMASKKFAKYCNTNKILFVDFNNHEIEGLDEKKYWFDNMHLNDNGATIFSEYLKEYFN